MIEGLKQSQPDKPKKVVYGSRKKKPGPQKDADNLSVTQVSTPETMSPAVKTEDLPVSEPPETPQSTASPMADVKDDWDAASEEEKPARTASPAVDVKSDWDESSGDDAPAKRAAESALPFSIAFIHMWLTMFVQKPSLRRRPLQRSKRRQQQRLQNLLKSSPPPEHLSLPQSPISPHQSASKNLIPNPKRTLMTLTIAQRKILMRVRLQKRSV